MRRGIREQKLMEGVWRFGPFLRTGHASGRICRRIAAHAAMVAQNGPQNERDNSVCPSSYFPRLRKVDHSWIRHNGHEVEHGSRPNEDIKVAEITCLLAFGENCLQLLEDERPQIDYCSSPAPGSTCQH